MGHAQPSLGKHGGSGRVGEEGKLSGLCREERWNWRLEGSRCFCSLGNGELHCASIQPGSNVSAGGLCLLTLRKPIAA